MADPKRLSNEFWLTILIFAVTTAFSIGWASSNFVTKKEVDEKYESKEIAKLKADQNEKDHVAILKALDELLQQSRKK